MAKQLDQGIARYFGIACNQLSDEVVIRQFDGTFSSQNHDHFVVDRTRRETSVKAEADELDNVLTLHLIDVLLRSGIRGQELAGRRQLRASIEIARAAGYLTPNGANSSICRWHVLRHCKERSFRTAAARSTSHE
jgi:hypothetical protein